MDPPRPWFDDGAIARSAVICKSFRRLLGRDLLEDRADGDGVSTDRYRSRARALWELPVPVLAHSRGDDPAFEYANRAALELFAIDWRNLIGTPSRLSAEPDHREARAEFLRRVARDGFVDDYSGVRITADGRRFLIEAAVVWNLADADGAPAGQAAAIGRWSWL